MLGSTGAHLLPKEGVWPVSGRREAEQQNLTSQITQQPPDTPLSPSSFPLGSAATTGLGWPSC